MGGPTTCTLRSATFGTVGVFASTNWPYSTAGGMFTFDPVNNRMYLFGGQGVDPWGTSHADKMSFGNVFV